MKQLAILLNGTGRIRSGECCPDRNWNALLYFRNFVNKFTCDKLSYPWSGNHNTINIRARNDENGKIEDIWSSLSDDPKNIDHFEFNIYVGNKYSRAIRFLIKRRNDGGMAWVAKDKL